MPLIGLAVCTQCHDATKASDPISACVPRGGQSAEQCFDEHARVREAVLVPNTVCAKQHGDDRFIAWDAAREIAATTPWVAPPKPEGTPWAPAGGALAGALVLGSVSTALERRRRRAVVAAPLKPAAPRGGEEAPRHQPVDVPRLLRVRRCVSVRRPHDREIRRRRRAARGVLRRRSLRAGLPERQPPRRGRRSDPRSAGDGRRPREQGRSRPLPRRRSHRPSADQERDQPRRPRDRSDRGDAAEGLAAPRST